jgi:murein L,D-transpeptidase YafK
MRHLTFLLLLCLPALAAADSETAPWIRIDVAQQSLAVMQGGEAVRSYRAAFGRNGPAQLRRAGDGTTPLGVYHVMWINTNSKYHIFFGLDYPNREQAELAWAQGVIDFDTYFAIRKALYKGRLPPQNTPLGGHIGIHGHGEMEMHMHRILNWTQGCVAVTNEQAQELLNWVKEGTRVEIVDGNAEAAAAHAVDAPRGSGRYSAENKNP